MNKRNNLKSFKEDGFFILRKTFSINFVESLKKGIAKTVEWYFNNEKWLKYCKKNYSGKRLGIND